MVPTPHAASCSAAPRLIKKKKTHRGKAKRSRRTCSSFNRKTGLHRGEIRDLGHRRGMTWWPWPNPLRPVGLRTVRRRLDASGTASPTAELSQRLPILRARRRSDTAVFIDRYAVVDDFGVPSIPHLRGSDPRALARHRPGVVQNVASSGVWPEAVAISWIRMPRATDFPDYALECEVPCKTNPVGVKGWGRPAASRAARRDRAILYAQVRGSNTRHAATPHRAGRRFTEKLSVGTFSFLRKKQLKIALCWLALSLTSAWGQVYPSRRAIIVPAATGPALRARRGGALQAQLGHPSGRTPPVRQRIVGATFGESAPEATRYVYSRAS